MPATCGPSFPTAASSYFDRSDVARPSPSKGFFDDLFTRSRNHQHHVSGSRLSMSTRRVFADVDGGDGAAWVALAGGFPAGICRYVCTRDDIAEVAFEVVDAEQGRGVGSVLVDAVTTVAGASRVEWLEAVAAPEDAALWAYLIRSVSRWQSVMAWHRDGEDFNCWVGRG